MKRIFLTVGAMVAMTTAQIAGAGNYCGDLKNAYGPFDYRTRAEHVDSFSLVEGAHFTTDVENGIKGATGTIAGDLDYTLRAIPNHPRALAAMVRNGARTKSLQPYGAKWPIECYFDRAMRFAPDDGAVMAEYGSFLYAQGKHERAFAKFKEAAALDPENPTINYNLGLAYFRNQDYSEALKFAKKAYSLGFPLPGLKNKLIAIGKWDDRAP